MENLVKMVDQVDCYQVCLHCHEAAQVEDLGMDSPPDPVYWEDERVA